AQLVEDAGKFVGDVAAAGDQDAFRQLVEMERLVAGDAEFVAGAVRDMRPGADSNKNVLSGDLRPVYQRHFIRAADRRALVDDLDAVVLERLRVEAVEAIDIAQD